MPDYYKILGIDRSSSQEDVKRAYRRLAMRFHPDQNQGSAAAEEQFRQIVDAWKVLGAPERRQFYDRFGVEKDALVKLAPQSGRVRLDDLMGDVIDELLRRPKLKPVSGKDRRYELELDFSAAAMGGARRISVDVSATCGGCAGSGSQPGSMPVKCHVCEGRGEVRDPGPLFAFRRVCNFCAGRGTVVPDPCARCGGTGTEIIEHALTVRVPPGADDGQRLRYRGAGESGLHGGPDGDLYIVLRVLPEPLFTRSGHDVIVHVPLTIREAVLGATVEVPMVDGIVRMSMPAGTQAGQRFRLKHRGIPRGMGKPRGDAYVEVTVEIPVGAGVPELVAAWPSADSDAHPRRREYEAQLRRRHASAMDEEDEP